MNIMKLFILTIFENYGIAFSIIDVGHFCSL